MSEQTEAEKRFEGAKSNLNDIWKIVEDQHKAIKDKYQKIIREECEVVSNFYADAIKDANSYVREAEEVLNAERLAAANTKTVGGVPVGGRVFEWEYNRWSERWTRKDYGGVIEVWSKESIKPGNLADYSIPSVGSIVIRYLNKIGVISKKFKSCNSGRSQNNEELPYGWFPEGVDPNEKK